MPLGCPGRKTRICITTSRARSNSISGPPSTDSRPRRQASSTRRPAVVVSQLSGTSPIRPRMTARSVPWPRPVRASDPNSSVHTRARPGRRPVPASSVRKRWAARMGPTVWEDEGPIPMEKRSRALRAMGTPPFDNAVDNRNCRRILVNPSTNAAPPVCAQHVTRRRSVNRAARAATSRAAMLTATSAGVWLPIGTPAGASTNACPGRCATFGPARRRPGRGPRAGGVPEPEG